MKLIVIETMYSTEKNKIINGFDYNFKALLRCLASSSIEHRIQDHVRFDPNGPKPSPWWF